MHKNLHGSKNGCIMKKSHSVEIGITLQPLALTFATLISRCRPAFAQSVAQPDAGAQLQRHRQRHFPQSLAAAGRRLRIGVGRIAELHYPCYRALPRPRHFIHHCRPAAAYHATAEQPARQQQQQQHGHPREAVDASVDSFWLVWGLRNDDDEWWSSWWRWWWWQCFTCVDVVWKFLYFIPIDELLSSINENGDEGCCWALWQQILYP